jgi:hypothetical protein
VALGKEEKVCQSVTYKPSEFWWRFRDFEAIGQLGGAQ